MPQPPIGINETKEGRHLITKNLAILVPFNTQELFQAGTVFVLRAECPFQQHDYGRP